MRTAIGTGSLHRYGKCTSIALQHAAHHLVSSRAHYGRSSPNSNAARVRRLARAAQGIGSVGRTVWSCAEHRAAPDSMRGVRLLERRTPERFCREHRSTRNSGRTSSVASTRSQSPTAHRCGGCVAQRCTAASIDGLGGASCELGERLAVHLLGGQRSFHSHLAVFTP